MPTVKVGDINMYYEVRGAGQPLLLVMGLASDSSSWMLQTVESSDSCQVIVFDNRGVGRSDAPDIPYSAKMMDDDTAGMMEAIGGREAYLLGMSPGGFIAQELAINHSKRVKSLVLVTAAACMPPGTKQIERRWAATVKEGISFRTLLNLQAPFLFIENLFQMPDLLNMFIDGMVASPFPPPPHGFARQAEACDEHDTRARLGRTAAPTMVLVGGEDLLLPVKVSEELASGIPGAGGVGETRKGGHRSAHPSGVKSRLSAKQYW